jgi:hypothetical protein
MTMNLTSPKLNLNLSQSLKVLDHRRRCPTINRPHQQDPVHSKQLVLQLEQRPQRHHRVLASERQSARRRYTSRPNNTHQPNQQP